MYLNVCYYRITHEFQSEPTLYSLSECQGTPCSKQAPYLKCNWQQRDSNSEPLSSLAKPQPFSQTFFTNWVVVVQITLLPLMVFNLWVEKFVKKTSVNGVLIFDQKGGDIWNLRDCNEFSTKTDLTQKKTLKYLTPLVKWLRLCSRVLTCMMNRLCILTITSASLK